MQLPSRLLRASFLVALTLAAIGAAQAQSLLTEERAFVAWEEAVYKAAEAAVQAVRLQSGAKLSLRDVPLDTLQVYTARQHRIGLSIDGINYEVVLGSDQELSQQYAAQANRPALPAGQEADEDSTAVATGLVRQHWQAQGTPGATDRLTLPDVTLSGPLELLVEGVGPVPVTCFTPHAVDMGPVRRVRLAAGVTVKVSGLRSIQLRRQLDLPSLPMGYLAEVYAHAKTREPGEDFDKAPGIHYLAAQLRALALNSSLPLLSFEVAPADEALGLVISSAATHAPSSSPPPRLKVRRDEEGSVELQLRQGEVAVVGGAEDVVQRSAALARPWAWPLPHVGMAELMPYETLLRSILAAHPFDLQKVNQKGISLRVTKSEITGTRLMAFEMEVRSRAGPHSDPQMEMLQQHAREHMGVGTEDEEQLMIFDVVVSVREGQHGRFEYVPVQVKLRELHGQTLSMSQASVQAMISGNAGNDSHPLPLGYDHQDLGVANRQQE